MAEERKRDINILLLGETGAGKSTFINAFHNYLKHDNLENAMKDKPIVLIPAEFKIMDENQQLKVVKIGDVKDELKSGALETRDTNSYVFPIRGRSVNVRLINTPSITNRRGIDFDSGSFENILDFLGELEHLNAICILLQPNSVNSTVHVEYCVKQLLLKLDKTVGKNLIFIFTKARHTTCYGPGETLHSLQKVFEGIKDELNVQIPLQRNNVFYFENESFRYLAAHHNGIKFSLGHTMNCFLGWKQSSLECRRLIDYIAGTDGNSPHLVTCGATINDTRCLIVNLSQPLAEIAQLSQDNITLLEKHKNELQSCEYQANTLLNKLYIPILNLNVTKLDQPVLVCTSAKCSELYEINGVKRRNYTQKCCSPCYLSGVPKEIIGSPLLASCEGMGGQPLCQKCRCEYQKHMYTYYTTATFLTKLQNVSAKSPRTMGQKLLVSENTKFIIKTIDDRLVEFKKERDVIIKTIAKFARFLEINAIDSYHDSYECYLSYLIDREKSVKTYVDNHVLIGELESMLHRYIQERSNLNHSSSGQSAGAKEISPNEILESIKTLVSLKHNADKLKELYSSQKSARAYEYKAKEHVYSLNGSLQRHFRNKSCKNTGCDSEKSVAK